MRNGGTASTKNMIRTVFEVESSVRLDKDEFDICVETVTVLMVITVEVAIVVSARGAISPRSQSPARKEESSSAGS